MDTYSTGAERASQVITETFSSSFSSAVSLLDPSIRQDIYNIYGIVRLADEIVDSYLGENTRDILDGLEQDIYRALQSGFSTNILVHSFCRTASMYGIDKELIGPFFESMRMDIDRKRFTQEQYITYIYGSAEVVGLMCLKVFTREDPATYSQLKNGAIALGAAYQKVNFLRDIRDDYVVRGRFYFPDTTYETLDKEAKLRITSEIHHDFSQAAEAIGALPRSARFATQLSYDYYIQLLDTLERMSVAELKEARASVSKWVKLGYLLRARIGQYAS